MPTEYIHFTEEQKQQARQTDLVALLRSQGEQLKRSGKEYVWRDGGGQAQQDSQKNEPQRTPP